MDINDWAEQLIREGGGGLEGALRKAMAMVAQVAEREGKINAGTRMRVRSGRLRNSIRGTVDVTETDGIHVVLAAGEGRGSLLPYAGAHEYGTTIRPKGKMLAIPLPAAKTPAGVLKGEFSRVGGLRAVPGLFVITSKRGNKLLCRTKGKGKSAQLIPLFYLHEGSITLRARNYLHDALRTAADQLPPAIGDALEIATRAS